MNKYKLDVTIEVTDKDIDGIVDAALNWCGYWCALLEYGKEPTSEVVAMSEALTHGGTLVFTLDEPYEEEGATRFELTVPKLLEGIKKYGDYDFEQFDGPMSDAVLQYALFGEIVYG